MIKKMILPKANNLLLVAICAVITLIAASSSIAAPNVEHEKIRLQSLNKLTARTSTFEVEVGDTIKLGSLYIRPKACRTNPATEEPETAGFLQIWTITDKEEKPEEQGKSEWVFSGWMFASSPGLSSMDHPVYDLWVIDCGQEDGTESIVAASTEEEASELIEKPEDPEGGFVIEESEGDDAPIVKLDGQDISAPEIIEEEQENSEQFEEYEDETDPIVHLD